MLLFRFFWFLAAAVMTANVAIWRRRLAPRVKDGTITPDEYEGFLRGATVALIGLPVVLGCIGIAAGWSDPFCAGILSFEGTARAAYSTAILAAWVALLAWVWLGNGTDLLGRIGPALGNAPRAGRRYPPAAVRAVITVVLVANPAVLLSFRGTQGCALPAERGR